MTTELPLTLPADETAAPGPLSSLTAAEIETAARILRDAGAVTDSTRFVYVGLLEPDKADVLAARAGTAPAPDREARLLLLDVATGDSTDAAVSLTRGEVVALVPIDGERGRVPILEEEFEAIGGILVADPRWLAALEKRGLTAEQVVYAPLSPGSYDIPGEEGRRIIRVFAFRMDHAEDHPWAHPVDGLCAYVDMIARSVTQVVDAAEHPVPEEPGNFHLESERPAPLDTLKPISITQPEGPSFAVDGDTVTWANWSFSLGFDAREGLILRDLAFADPDQDGAVRPVIYRASIAEMVVPYADPSPTRYWQNYFDTGEYLFGRFANSLTLGCDCLGEIRYFDAVMADEFGRPKTVANAICMHEEDYGTLWKHTDMFTSANEVRRSRRLVISFFTTVGNYDYGFYWYLYLDGTIECEAKLTGILFTSAYVEGTQTASEVAPGLGAPYHQHLFSARLDMMVDGLANAVEEVDAVRLPISAANPYGNAFTKRATRIASEAEGARAADASVGRTWHIVNTEKTNRLGQPTGYVLHAEQNPTLMADPSATVTARAAFTTKQVWVTQYASDERYPAGEFVNQNPGGDGLPAYMAADRPLDGEDIVLWHTFGPTHFPRVEDWPVMPVDYAKFTLKPYGFFGRNPALNVPAAESAHCAPGHHEHGAHGDQPHGDHSRHG
ncbi:primary-amine oxidase [Leifsonia naganoensis]|uniref:Amine oxidase n=1 Tax=Leifsonia naganoensis TaxID=150025 RepID=A0A853DUU1_9MICO|nr:primary-amine oxidase [Leifsonia naganoensis]NYK12067.1 primary-amine oxidase [Leifsonia naganoensis]